MIWDIEGVDIFTDLKPSYLRGASGILLVIDGTRSKSLETAKQVKQLVDDNLGKIPTLLLINKSDLRESWQFSEDDTKSLAISENNTFITSAKTDQNVERAFERITHLMVED